MMGRGRDIVWIELEVEAGVQLVDLFPPTLHWSPKSTLGKFRKQIPMTQDGEGGGLN